jgi:hypothetical protein
VVFAGAPGRAICTRGRKRHFSFTIDGSGYGVVTFTPVRLTTALASRPPAPTTIDSSGICVPHTFMSIVTRSGRGAAAAVVTTPVMVPPCARATDGAASMASSPRTVRRVVRIVP